MTHTNTDYLFQMTTTMTDRTYGVPAVSDGAGTFDNHLSQAATSSGDDSSNRASSQRTETSQYDRDDRSWNTGPSQSNDHGHTDSTSSRSASANQDDSAEAASESKAPADDADSEQHEVDESDDTTAADVAAANQATTNNTTKTEAKSKPTKNAAASATAKAAAIGKRAATEAGERNATGKAERQAASDPSLPDIAAQQTGEAEKLVAEATPNLVTTNEDANASQEAAPDGKQSKSLKVELPAVKSKKGAPASNETAQRSDSADGAAAGVISHHTAQKTVDVVEVSATTADAEAATTKNKSKTDESAEDDTRTVSPDDTRPAARNDASVSSTKVDAAQLAGSVPAPSITGASTPPKSKDNDQTTKPVGAKGEPVAAAFARLTRNNLTGAKDSTAGANDLPQVDPARFIGRVAKAFQTAQDRGGTLQLRLSPPELGALRIELNVKDGVMSASLQTENANARRLLLDHLPALRDRLAEQNIRVDRFDVDVRDGSSGQTDTRGSQQQYFQHQPDQPAPRRQVQPEARTREATATERSAIVPVISDARLNLIV